MKAIYLDHAATTPVHPKVAEAMTESLQKNFGNPSSIHSFGRKARQILDKARSVAAQSIHASDKDIVFTSGGTEADNIAITGVALANQAKGKHIITTKIEHHATLHTVENLEKQGFEVTYLDVNEHGEVELQQLKNALRDDTILVTVMMVNNETGVIQPIAAIGELLEEHQTYFHTDAVQAYGMLPIKVGELKVDLLTVSSHKINGPKGLGFLYVHPGVTLQALQHGGEQERKRRPGTENVAAIAGFTEAIQLALTEREQRYQEYQDYRDRFLQMLRDQGIDFSINGEKSERVPNIINVSFPGTNVEALLTNFDLSGVAASSGSACTAGSVEPSHVLSAMFTENSSCTTNSIRFSFGLANNQENVTEAAEKVAKIVTRLTT
ncbi:aminotransferase class V-fold PLP-dependent enzyme [Gracilibacillus salitolerans]|uniref:cysteine desulfurase n=1 Tax=Gracilibacillus salitolerans TaxID=2663022 RepID=A0A5Q2TK68_9BACI|nr:cysteine desulfurase family protein [Gracilibacillus salitolerans]QGH35065.1 aminotransferase class V-fold PLP-dependent enzyme [Gracilibacillus salitolerans]